jgi:LysR family transcriptional regulator, carnitine catabolism transcriptional activator
MELVVNGRGNDAGVSLAKMKSFVAVAETLQFRRAAEALGISQATLSTHIRDFERELGVALFSRTTRNVRLTAEGERFLYRAQKVLEDLSGAISDVRDQAELKRGRLIVAATPSVASNVLPDVIATFRARYPGVTIQVAEDRSSAVEHRVQTGEADFGVGPRSGQRTDLSFTYLCRDRIVAVVSRDHALAKRSRVRLERLLEYPLLRSIPEMSARRSLEAVLRDRGLELHTEHLLTQDRGTPQTVVAMVAAGLGIALLPSLALAMLDLRRIALLNVIDPELSREIGILQRKGGSQSSAATEFLRLWTATTRAS